MKKIMPIALIIVVAVLAVGAWIYLGKGAVTLPVEIKKEAGESGEAFIGTLKQAIARGVPMQCTFENNYMSSTSYIKGKKLYVEVSQEGKDAYMIMVDNCMWSWEKDGDQGIKMCFEETEETGDIWDMQGEGEYEGEYNCRPAVVADSKFNPPTEVNFMDMSQGFGVEE